MLLFVWLFALLPLAVLQPLYGLEKQILYGFQDPDEIQWSPEHVDALVTKRGGRLLNLIGLNSRFTDPFRVRMIKKKIRSVQDNDHTYDN
ncbi:unnamed protein product [Nippostrongylus brasiliensis]|uniref:Uncharacterized protein n=1 Tax=Nippostrongylus brasiliensis TaxID=27835 RepID=A0A0N4YF12_NIPBR|nr:hypothetical protein Q1695_006363 [Nippostrongylus brasiliensis]VDL78915.1 unnamed protein product [Nippostrongylus brasiliensis]